VANGIFQKLSGVDGRMIIESLGSPIGEIGTWTLTRRGDGGPKEGLYDFRAVFSYVNPHLWADDDYAKTIFIKIATSPGKKQQFRLEQDPEFVSQLSGRSLLMEGVRLVPVE